MMMRVFVRVVILVAVVVGVLTLVLNRDQLEPLIVFRDFFDVTIPILGFGALVKFLCRGMGGGCGCGAGCNCKGCNCQKK